jgi:lysophospholipase L1-like esterase
LLEVVAKEEGAQYLPASERIPADQQFFSDATHFSLRGERLFAESLADVLTGDLASRSTGRK